MNEKCSIIQNWWIKINSPFSNNVFIVDKLLGDSSLSFMEGVWVKNEVLGNAASFITILQSALLTSAIYDVS